MNMKEINGLNKAELQSKALECKKKIAELRFEKASGRLLDPSQNSKKRKELARILTRYNQLLAQGN